MMTATQTLAGIRAEYEKLEWRIVDHLERLQVSSSPIKCTIWINTGSASVDVGTWRCGGSPAQILAILRSIPTAVGDSEFWAAIESLPGFVGC